MTAYEKSKERAERRTRLENEYSDLAAKCTKLKFKMNEATDDLPKDTVEILRNQLTVMREYKAILEKRLATGKY